MTTFADITSRIADDINRTDLTTQIGLAVNRAINFYQKEPFWFKETSASFSTVASQASYSSTDTSITDIDRIRYMDGLVNNGEYEIDPRTIKWIRTKNPQLAIGIPTSYAWWQNKIWFYLVPDAIYTVTIYYTKKYVALTGSNTNDWLTYAEDLIEARARKWIYTRILKQQDNALLAEAEEQQALQQLREVNEGYTAQAEIPPSQF